MTISKVLRTRLDLNKMDEEKQAALAKSQQEKKEAIINDIKQFNGKMKTKIGEFLTETAQTCYNHMLTDQNKETILNPIGKERILDLHYSNDYTSEISSRLYEYFEGFLKSREVSTKFTEIMDELVAFYEAKCQETSDIENEWVDEATDAPQNEIYGSEAGIFLTESIIAGLLLGLAISPISVPVHSSLRQTAIKREIVEKEYNNFRENTVREFVRDVLTKDIRDNLKKFELMIIRRLEVLDESTKELLKSQKESIAKCDIIEDHVRHIKTMEEKCNILQ